MNTSEENCKIWRNFFFFEISKSIRRQEIYYNDQKNTKNFNDTHMEPVLYWIQYKNSLKYKVGCFWCFSYGLHNQLSSFNSIIAQMSKKHDSSNRQ